MKKLLPVLAIFSWALASCVDDPLAHDNMPVVTLAEPADLKRTSVILEADLDGPDIGSVTEIGFILGENSSLNDNVVKVSVEEVAKGRFSALVKDLQIGHTYFYAAYATNGRQTVKSQVEALTTLTRSSALLGDIEVYEVGDETFLRSSIEDDGGSTINMAGFCFDTNENPTIYKGNIQAKLEDDGSFTANVTEYLDEGKTYYLRAFVDNDILGDGTTSISYGLQTVYTVPKIEKVNIPDAVFKAYIVENFDKNGDKEISLKEAAAITEINVNTNDIATLKGVECFENMEILRVRGNHFEDKGQLKELDLRANKRLTYISCTYNILESLYLPENNIIEHIDLFQNSLKYINTLDCPELTYLDLSYSYLTEVDLCGCPKLVELHYHCNLDDVRGKVDISGLINLKKLYLENAECPETLNEVNDLEVLHLINAGLQSFDFSMFPNLINFNCSDNELSELDLSHALNLKELGVRNIGISNIDVSELQNLESLECGSNELTELNISNNFKLTSLGCTYNKLSRLDISNNKSLDFLSCLGNQDLYTIYVWNGFSESDITQLYKPSYTRYVIKGQGYGGPSILSDIPDENFRAYVLENFDYDSNGDVTTDEALEVKSMTLNTDNVYSLEGIKYFENLQRLDASGTTDGMNMTGRLAELDLTSNSQLTDVRSCYNHIETVSLSPEAKLTHLSLECNQELTSVQNLNLTKMKDISFWRTALTELDLREAVDLESFSYNCVREDAVCVVNVEGLSGLTHANIVNADKIIGLPGCTNLVSLDVLWCVIDDLNLNNHPNLTHFRCDGCGLTELDLRPLTELTYMTCSYNKFSSGYLDISANKKLTCIYTDGCGLHTIYVWEGFNEADYPDFHKDASTRYVVKGQGYGGPSILSDIPDENFRAYVHENFDYDGNGDVTTDEALRVESIDLNTDNVYSLEGIRYFENLGSLVARGTEYYEDWKYRGQLTELDLSYNQKLYNIWCGFNHIKYIKFHPDAIIETLNIGYNQELTGFSEFDMSKLTYVALRETMVTDLDLRGAVNLYGIEYSYSPDPEIKRSLNIDGLTKITRMELRHLDGNLDVSNLSNLEYLCADYCNLKELDLRNRSKLKVLIVDGNQLTAIDLNGCIMLESLSIPYNLLGELDLQDNMKLTYMNSYGNPDLRTIYVWEGFNEADYPDFHKDASTRYVVKGQDYGSPSILSDIPDENFRAYVLENFDYDGNGDVTTEEALLVESIDLNTDNVYSLEGIKHFANLKYLAASGTEKYSGSNPGCLTELDLSGNVNLKLLYCFFNHIESIVFHPDTQPEVLNVGYNNELSYISSFDMSQLSVLKLRYTMIDELDLRTAANLRVLEYSYTHSTLTRTLNIEGLTKIEDLELEYLNGSLDVSLLSNLVSLSVRSSNLKELDLRNNKKLTYLSCSDNELDALDVSQLVELEDLDCPRNNISVLDVSVNTKLSYLSAYDNPDLRTIYVWEGFNEADYPDFYKDETATYVVKQ